MTEFATTLDTIIEKAKALRSAGVTEVTAGGVRFVLAPFVEEAAITPQVLRKLAADEVEIPEDNSDPFNDPALYPGGKVPGFRRRRRRPDEEAES